MEQDKIDEYVQFGASIVKSNDNVEGVFMKDGDVISVDYPKNKITLRQIAERFEKFLSNDIEGLGNDERDELLDCCYALKFYSNKIDMLVKETIVFSSDVIRTIKGDYDGIIEEPDKESTSETPNCS